MNQKFLTNKFKNYFFILLGTLFISLGVVLFFIPNSFTTGGTPGMAILIHKLTDFSMGTIIFLINVPLIALGTKYLGKSFALRTIIAIILISVFIDTFSFLNLQAITHNILLASLFGGAFIGFGVGFIIKGNASAGGTTTIAKIIAANSEIKPSQVILFIDFLIILSSIYVFDDIEKALWSTISIYVTARCIDIVLTGALSKKVVHIVSNKAEFLSEVIAQNLGEQGSIVKGVDLKSQKNKTIIFIVVDVKKLGLLREIIQQNDPNAFMIVMEASEMLGRDNH